jgi:UPF0716 protein FxsA
MKLRFFIIGYPLVEIAAAVGVAHVIGWPMTIALLITGIPIGIVITQRVSRQAFATMTEYLRAGQLPSMGDAGAIIGGILITVPGFLTDAVGAVLLIPGMRRKLWGEQLPPSSGDVIYGHVVVDPESPELPRA